MSLLQTSAVIACLVGAATASTWDRTTHGMVDPSGALVTVDTNAAVSITVEPTYKAGATVEMRLHNTSNTAYGFNACQRTIEKRDGQQWAPVTEPPMSCTMQLDVLPAKGTATARTQLPDSLGAGEYRFELKFTPQGNSAGGGAAVEAASNAFRVQ